MSQSLIPRAAVLLALAACAHPRAAPVELVPAAVQVFNRAATPLADGERRGLHLDERPGGGVAWVGNQLETGIIEVDLRGRDVVQKSFVGIAFAGKDEEHCEIVYLRPFNFRSDDPERAGHSIQYVAAPDQGWKRLREEHPKVFETALAPPPDPNGWVHLRLIIDQKQVRAEVDGKPALTVDRLKSGGGRVGLFVGDNSDGDFANLRIE